MKTVYLAGSLKNWKIVDLANDLNKIGYYPFADWIVPGPEADTFLLKYAKKRGWSYKQTLASYAAQNIFAFDKSHIDQSDALVLVTPAGKSAHLELGYAIGQGKPGFILFDKEPKRLDVMYNFATEIFFEKSALFGALKRRLG